MAHDRGLVEVDEPLDGQELDDELVLAMDELLAQLARVDGVVVLQVSYDEKQVSVLGDIFE